MKNNNTLIVGVVCAKDHSGNHTLHRAGAFAECQGCLEYYTSAEVSQAKAHQSMLARGLRRLTLEASK